MFRSCNLKSTALLMVIVIGLVVLPGTQPLRAPVTRASLEGLFGFRNLSFDPAQDEIDIVNECRQVARQYHFTYGKNGQQLRRFDDPEQREVLESILERKPDFFYAQYLLGTWYRRNGDPEKGQELLAEAMKKAPIVLTQRYLNGKGETLPGLKIATMAIECNRVKNHSLNPELHLEFFDLVTDSRGEISMPVYDTVFRIASRSYPGGYDTEMPALGWFKSPSRIGELPDVMAWKKYSRPTDFNRTAAQSVWLSGAKGTTASEIKSGSNIYRIGRVARCQADGRFVQKLTDDSTKLPDLPLMVNAEYMDHATIDLTSPAPDRFEISSAVVVDSKTKIPLMSFQPGAGVKAFDKTRFHLYSLRDKLPDEVDLVLNVTNFEADSLRMTIPVEAKGDYKKDDITFHNEYLGAGQHQGWNSKDGFYKDAKSLSFTSEMLCKIDAPSDRRMSLLVVTNDGQRISLPAFSLHIRIPKPLTEIDHFELVPQVEPKKIYFEKITLPPRSDQISTELPAVNLRLTGNSETVSSELFTPLVLRCTTYEGDVSANGMFSSEFGWGFDEQNPDNLYPESKSTVVIEAFGPPGIKLSPEFSSRSKGARLQSAGGTSMSSGWGQMTSNKFLVPLSDLNFVTLRLNIESPAE